ncbi:MAG: ribosome assembly cofactor RimP [Muribaculaceae bacterium]|nr:ribosome assembly cofactor RimP [Muribaculaceae bacterium]
MIDRQALKEFVENKLEGSDKFLVDLKVSNDNNIEVEIDSDNPLSIDECEALSRLIESEFDRDKEDYTLEVGSAGLTSPLKVPRQFRKYIGREIETVTNDGRKLSGLLKSADDNGFTVTVREKIKKEGMKRPVMEEVDYSFSYGEVKQTKYLLKF